MVIQHTDKNAEYCIGRGGYGQQKTEFSLQESLSEQSFLIQSTEVK